MIINGIFFVTQFVSAILCRTIMKISIIIFSQVWLLLAVCSSCSHDNNNIPIPKNCDELKAQGIIDSFPYPIRPGSEAWKNLKTSAEKYEAVSVPADILEEMCTHGLVYTCVYCPLFISNLTVFNCDRDGFTSLCNHINSFDELTKREDAGIELFDYYTLLTDTALNNITLFSCRFQIYSVEKFFSQQEFLSQFNNDLLNEVLLKAYDNLLIKEKLEIDRTFYAANLYLTANTLYFNIKYPPLIDFIDNYETLDIFCNSDLWNEEVIDSLRHYTEEYVEQNLR
jgi:hypothetical protein